MSLFKRSQNNTTRPTSAQLRNIEKHPFSAMANYVPLSNADVRLYRLIREAVPVIDAAIYKLIRLTGGLSVTCSNPTAERKLQHFLQTVEVGRGQVGLASFLDCYLDSLLTCGRAVGEILPNTEGTDIVALLCGCVEQIDIVEGETPLDFQLCLRNGSGISVPLPRQHLLLFTPLNPETENPYGVSLLRSMPFLSELLLQIYHTMGKNWERCGNVRYAVVYQPQDEELERGVAQERAEQIAHEWSAAMQSGKDGYIRDFVSVGDVSIRVIGADNQILDSQVPVRQILEQLVAKTGLPPFMLGLNWSSTERMSTQQADILTTEITALRRTLTPIVEKICRLWLHLHGYPCSFQVVWDDINLQDQVEESRASLYAEQARKLKLENDMVEHRGNTT